MMCIHVLPIAAQSLVFVLDRSCLQSQHYYWVREYHSLGAMRVMAMVQGNERYVPCAMMWDRTIIVIIHAIIHA